MIADGNETLTHISPKNDFVVFYTISNIKISGI
jgi:hypothetical protein